MEALVQAGAKCTCSYRMPRTGRVTYHFQAGSMAVVILEKVYAPIRKLSGVHGLEAQRAGEVAAGGRARVAIDSKLKACHSHVFALCSLRVSDSQQKPAPFTKANLWREYSQPASSCQWETGRGCFL